MKERLVALLLAALLLPAGAMAQADAESLRAAKALFFDRQYAQARDAWQAVRASGRGPDAQAALYWVARCSESLGESERALGEYGQYLAARPADRALVEEAKTSRVALAVKLAKAGKTQHLDVAREALADPNRTVRYFAALQLASLGTAEGKAAVPVLREILARTGAQSGDLVFFGAERETVVNDALGALRARVGHDRGLAEPGWKPLWVVDFPMFEYDEDRKTWAARHHPFTAPKDGHEDRFSADPAHALAKAYDVVLNGWEMGGGSVRIHRPEVQEKVFAALGISPEEQQRKFGFLLNALKYGAPPHGGIAFGLDRIVTMMCGAESIRDVIAFPKTQRGQDLLVEAPTPVTEQQLRDLHIKVRPSDAMKVA